MAHQDLLTGLPSRQAFDERLAEMVRTETRQERLFALMLLDIEALGSVNEQYGYPFGDALLLDTAELLASTIRETDSLWRFGDHDFALLLTNLEDSKSAHHMTRRIIERLSQPRVVDGREIKSEINVGISFCALDSSDPAELVGMAETALARAKADDGSRYHLYDKALHRAVKAQEILEDELQLALLREEFLLHYQPLFELASSSVVGAEALIYWQHPTRGLLAPSDWLHAAETSGLMVPIGEWALRQACGQNRAWQSAGMTPLALAVSISASQFHDDGLLPKIEAALADSGLPASSLILQFGEGTVSNGLGGRRRQAAAPWKPRNGDHPG